MVEESLVNNVLLIRVQAGVMPDGKAIVKKLRMEGVKTTATNEEIFEVGAKISEVLMFPVLDIYKAQEFCLVES